jgi:hypothetical protein
MANPWLLVYGRFAETISRRVSEGVTLLVAMSFTHAEPLEIANSFLAKYGIKATMIGMYRVPDSGTHQPLESETFELFHEAHPQAFRDFQLFADVKRLVVRSPMVISYSDRVHAILVIPEAGVQLIEQTTDLPADWTAHELASIVGYYDRKSGGSVLAFSGSIISDRLLAEDLNNEANHLFASNLLDWVMRRCPQGKLRAENLCKQIERFLFDFVKKCSLPHLRGRQMVARRRARENSHLAYSTSREGKTDVARKLPRPVGLPET